MSGKNFTVYKSSAGSGKTFTLVKEYLALALNDENNPPKSYRNILAITFTNKAASEMKERIIRALKELSQNDISNVSGGTLTLLNELKKHPKLNQHKQLDDDTIRKRADNVLSAILHNYSDFAISTIDSFVQRIVRTFAFDLKIPMSFDIEMDDDKLLTQAVDLLIAQIGNDELLTKALVEFTESKTDDEKNWHIENDLKYFAKNLLNEEGDIHIQQLKNLSLPDFFKIKTVLQNELKTFDAYVSQCGKDALKLMNDAGVTEDKLASGNKGIAKYFSYLEEVKHDKLTPNATVQKNIDNDVWYAGKATNSDKSSIDGIKSQLLQLYDKAWDYIQINLQNNILFRLINTTLYSLAVLNEIEKLLNEYKAQNNILHISEFNKMIAKIVLNEPIPFIYERLGEKYNNYLIDEFQDTSILQFQNLLPLIDNSLANGHFTMLVGDGKQAIYRWRGGDVEQFAILPNVFQSNNNPLIQEREQALKRNYNPQVLDKNYRSKREIIEFNNSIFRTLSDKLNDKYKGIYDTLEQGFNPDNTGGYVQVEFLDAEKEELYNKNLERTSNIIRELQEQNYGLKDIAILVRKNYDGSMVANHLSQQGIEVISSDSLLLSHSPEVNFIFALIKFINNREDKINQAELLNYLSTKGGLQHTDINKLLTEEKQEKFINVLKQVFPEFNMHDLSKMALYELNEELIRMFGLHSTPNPYIQFYLDEVLNYSIKQNNNIKDFIEYWTDKKEKASLVIPKGINAVSIMTIHQSKGLEFPAVILPFSNGKVDNGKKHLWVDVDNDTIPELKSAMVAMKSELEQTIYADAYHEEKNKSLLDSLNVLYVALTRPEERLYILTGKPSKTPANFNNLTDMFAYYYQTKGEWNETKNIYTFGYPTNRQEAKHKKHEELTNFQFSTFNSNNWRNSIKMRAAAPSIWNLEAINNKKDYGVMVHTAMAKIKTADDIEPAIESMFLQGLINGTEKHELITTINKIIEHQLVKPHFVEGLTIKNEAEIITPSGDMLRPDRVILHSNKAIIIDYKTGKEQTKHKQQIIEYADLLNQMGYTVTEKLLIYIEEEKVLSC